MTNTRSFKRDPPPFISLIADRRPRLCTFKPVTGAVEAVALQRKAAAIGKGRRPPHLTGSVSYFYVSPSPSSIFGTMEALHARVTSHFLRCNLLLVLCSLTRPRSLRVHDLPRLKAWKEPNRNVSFIIFLDICLRLLT